MQCWSTFFSLRDVCSGPAWGFLINAVYSMPLQTVMESKEITIQVPKVIMEEVEITYQVPAMETKTRTVQRPKTIM